MMAQSFLGLEMFPGQLSQAAATLQSPCWLSLLSQQTSGTPSDYMTPALPRLPAAKYEIRQKVSNNIRHIRKNKLSQSNCWVFLLSLVHRSRYLLTLPTCLVEIFLKVSLSFSLSFLGDEECSKIHKIKKIITIIDPTINVNALELSIENLLPRLKNIRRKIMNYKA